MENLIFTGGGAKPVFVSLGTGTSFDVKSVCSANGIDYTKLTANNFVIMSVSGISRFTANSGSVAEYAYGGSSFTKSYNASTGKLSCYYNVYIGGWYNTASVCSNSSNGKVTVYLVYGFE